jgi:SAM-dependent methyltransferase
MFKELEALVARPAPFSTTTTALLWADPHTSEHMLRNHLDGTVNFSSRTTDVIDRSIDWLTATIGVGAGTRVLDLGCGPGLYGNRLAAIGADVTGVDFSARSIRYAQDTAPPGPRRATYIQGNYLDIPIPGTFDIALMIFCDFCALSPEQRGRLLQRLRTLLKHRWAVHLRRPRARCIGRSPGAEIVHRECRRRVLVAEPPLRSRAA